MQPPPLLGIIRPHYIVTPVDKVGVPWAEAQLVLTQVGTVQGGRIVGVGAPIHPPQQGMEVDALGGVQEGKGWVALSGIINKGVGLEPDVASRGAPGLGGALLEGSPGGQTCLELASNEAMVVKSQVGGLVLFQGS